MGKTLTAREAETLLLMAGFVLVRTKGSHHIYRKGNQRIVIPFHSIPCGKKSSSKTCQRSISRHTVNLTRCNVGTCHGMSLHDIQHLLGEPVEAVQWRASTGSANGVCKNRYG